MSLFAALLECPPPHLIPTGQYLWYDPSNVGTVHATAGRVDQLDDISGNARHLTSSGTNRPYTGRSINGLGVLDFQAAQVMATANITRAQPVTVFCVAKADITSTGNRQVIGDASTCPTIYCSNSSGEKWAYYATTQCFDGLVDLNNHQLCGVFNGASSALYKDGTSVSTANPGSSGWSAAPFRLGNGSAGTQAWDGIIGEVLMYPSALSTGDRQAVEAYLRGKWGLP